VGGVAYITGRGPAGEFGKEVGFLGARLNFSHIDFFIVGQLDLGHLQDLPFGAQHGFLRLFQQFILVVPEQ
jgi:hypothetical protein